MKKRINKYLVITLLLWAVESVTVMWIYGHHPRMFFHYDSLRYIDAVDTLLTGRPDLYRTPVYPLFIGLTRLLLPAGSDVWTLSGAVVAVQHLLFAGSIALFRSVARMVTKDERAVTVAGLLYALCPMTTVWNALVMTESLSLSGMVALTYCLLRAARTGRVRYALLSGVLLLLLVGLRPSFAYLAVAIAIGWLLLLGLPLFKRTACVGLAMVAAVTPVAIGYMAVFERHYGLFAPTVVGTANRYAMLRISGEMRADAVSDPEVRRIVGQGIATHTHIDEYGELWGVWQEINSIVDQHGPAALDRACRENVTGHPSRLWRCLWRNLSRSMVEPMLSPSLYAPWTGRPHHYIARWAPAMGWLYAFALVFGLATLWNGVRQQRLPWTSTMLTLLVWGNWATVIVGAQSDWSRLMVPSLPAILLMALVIGRELITSRQHKIENIK